MVNPEIKIPLKIIRYRKKQYTQKRCPYKTYLNAKWNWVDIFKEIERLKSIRTDYLIFISNKYGINYNTLKKKYIKGPED